MARRTVVVKVNIADEADYARILNALDALPGVVDVQHTIGAGLSGPVLRSLLTYATRTASTGAATFARGHGRRWGQA